MQHIGNGQGYSDDERWSNGDKYSTAKVADYGICMQDIGRAQTGAGCSVSLRVKMKHDEARWGGQQMDAGVARSRRGAGHSLCVYGPHPRLGLQSASNSVAMVMVGFYGAWRAVFDGRLGGPSIVQDDEAERRGTLMKSARWRQTSLDVGSRGSK